MTNYWTPGPENIPSEILKVTPNFKKKVLLAFLGLLMFILFYFGLMLWFGYQSYHLFYLLTHGGENKGFLFIAGICFTILALFMFKSLIFFNKRNELPFKELTRASQPEMFDFIHKVADETGAPKPNKIFLSDRVNASVFYDLSLINILIPSKKNLEVGLGLLNVLNISEFKAILAHEFGHFAQKSMLLGRYVYVAQQLAQRIVYKRDLLDRGLAGLSSFDLRVAWVGWILSIIVWSIRSLVQVIFGIVVISERALSREMEFQADNVAVSVTGSDALIHGLHKLRAADEGYNISLSVINNCLQDKKAVKNLFSLQSHYIEKMRWVMDDKNFGTITENYPQNETTRIFKNGLINPPEMWATHPSDMDRENNAKRIYIYAPIDQRGAINLLQKSQEIFEKVTANLIATAKIETELLSDEASIQRMDDEYFQWTFLDPKYKSVYHGRFTFQNFESINEIYDSELSGNLDSEYQRLYPDIIKVELEWLRELQEEIALLDSALNQVRTAENKKIIHRGNEISRNEIPAILVRLNEQEKEVRAKVKDHDRRCRLVNYKAATTLHPAYAHYLKSIAELVHYAEHTFADLQDLMHKFQHSLFVIFADNRVTEAEQSTLVVEANRLWNAMSFVSESMSRVTLNKKLLERLNISSPEELFEEFKFAEASRDNLNSWLNNYGSWYESYSKSLQQLRSVALESLLEAEAAIESEYLTKQASLVIAEAPKIPNDYPRLTYGNERKVALKLSFWDKFHGEIGLFPTIAKFSAAALILITAILVGRISVDSNLHITNAFDIPVTAQIDGTVYQIPPHAHLQVTISGDADIVTTTEEGDTIDYFIGAYDAGYREYVYNIGSGDYLQKYEVVYGYRNPSPPSLIGANRWLAVRADYIFQNPPKSLESTSDGATKMCISSILTDPTYLPDLDLSNKEAQRMIKNHLRYDNPNGKYAAIWIQLYAAYDSELNEIKALAKRSPENVNAQRMIMDLASDNEKDQMRLDFHRQFEKTKNVDFKYLEIRAMKNDLTQDSAFIAACITYPKNDWLNMANGFIYARKENWDLADDFFRKAMQGRNDLSTMIVNTYVRVHKMKYKQVGMNFRHKDFYFNPFLEYALSIDQGDRSYVDDEVELIPYFLSDGNFAKVETLINTAPAEVIDRFSWLRAASEPYNENLLNAAINSDARISLSNINCYTAIGLLAARNRDYSDVMNHLAYLNRDKKLAKKVQLYIDSFRKNDLTTARALLDSEEQFEFKTHIKLIACIMLEDKAPYEWWQEVTTMLFAHEKPYLGYCYQK